MSSRKRRTNSKQRNHIFARCRECGKMFNCQLDSFTVTAAGDRFCDRCYYGVGWQNLKSLMKTTQKDEKSRKSVTEMTNECLHDRGLQSLLAKKAQIFSPQCIAEDNCLWVTGAGIFTSYRQMFINVRQVTEDAVKISVTIVNDDRGHTNFLIWGYGDKENKSSVAQMLIFIIEDILTGGGEEVFEAHPFSSSHTTADEGSHDSD